MIDWTTTAFQIVNFLILLALLRKFLYGRIIRAMDERERGIAERVQQAEAAQQEAEKKAQEFEKKTRELEGQRDELLAQARKDAEARREELVGQVRAEVDRTRAQWLEALESEKDGFLEDLRSRVSQQTLAIARRALADLADAALEERIVGSFLQQIESVQDAERHALAEAIAKTADEEGTRHALVRSAFDLPEETRRRLAEAIGQHIVPDVEVDFATSGEVVGGIEIAASGTKLAWSIGHYLASLEEELRQAIEQMHRAAADAQAQQDKEQKEEQAQEKEEEEPEKKEDTQEEQEKEPQEDTPDTQADHEQGEPADQEPAEPPEEERKTP